MIKYSLLRMVCLPEKIQKHQFNMIIDDNIADGNDLCLYSQIAWKYSDR